MAIAEACIAIANAFPMFWFSVFQVAVGLLLIGLAAVGRGALRNKPFFRAAFACLGISIGLQGAGALMPAVLASGFVKVGIGISAFVTLAFLVAAWRWGEWRRMNEEAAARARPPSQ